jgi:hypothetical protein
MMAFAELSPGLPTVSSTFSYLKRDSRYASEKPYYYSGDLPLDYENSRTNLKFEVGPPVLLRDLRVVKEHIHLDTHGVELFKNSSKTLAELRFGEIPQLYLQEMSNIVKIKLQAELVITYDYRVSAILRDPIILAIK